MSGFNFQVALPGEASPKPAQAKKWATVMTNANRARGNGVREALNQIKARNVFQQRKSRRANRKSRKAERKSRRAERKSRKAERKSRRASRKSRRAGRR
jgi:hypothetical protein